MTIDRLLLRHAASSPDAIAVSAPSAQVTYRDLARAARGFADALDALGAQNGDRLVAALEPGLEAVALLCACSQRGVIWVPVNPDSPVPRIDAIVDSVRPVAVVGTAGASDLVRDAATRARVASGRIEGTSIAWSAIPTRPRRRPRAVVAIDPAYIIFTSGSTGRPKGIVMTHRAACAFLEALIAFTGLARGSVVGSIAPVQFDFWLLDTALALGSGATVAFIPRSSFYQPRRMAREMRQLEVTQMNGVPSIWGGLLHHAAAELAAVETLQSILFAGEAFPLGDLRQLRAMFPALRVINCFGQSESIACSMCDVPNPLPADAVRLAIGRGHPGVEMLNIDDGGHLIAEPGVVGELYLRAPSLFSGYWADEAATAKALVLNPLLPDSGERVFKTGDLVSFDETGDFYFAGRIDEQIKILGNRVELGDIAATLRAMPGVSEAVAVSVPSRSSTAHAVIACIVPASDQQVTQEAVRAWCLGHLPRYMLPAHIDVMPALPLNANGKVDTRRIKEEWSRRLSASAPALPGADVPLALRPPVSPAVAEASRGLR
jgi:amino acid adenylation domain-containing protein